MRDVEVDTKKPVAASRLTRRVVGWAVPALLLAVSGFNIACALGYGRAAVVRGHDPSGSSVVGALALLAFVGAIVVAAVLVARPDRVVASFAPCVAFLVLTYDLTYDAYFAPSLQRYWDGATNMGEHVVGGFLLAGAVAAVAWRRPRAGAALTVFAVPIVALTLIAYLGH